MFDLILFAESQIVLELNRWLFQSPAPSSRCSPPDWTLDSLELTPTVAKPTLLDLLVTSRPKLKVDRKSPCDPPWASPFLSTNWCVFKLQHCTYHCVGVEASIPDHVLFYLFDVFTASSARPINSGYPADNFRCLICHLLHTHGFEGPLEVAHIRFWGCLFPGGSHAHR